MNKNYFLLLCLFFLQSVNAQVNLVPNPSFEDTIKCPVSINQTITTKFWSSYGGTSDYFNSCAAQNSCGVSVPFNISGYQHAATGNAYCGLIAYQASTSGPVIREYIGTYLTSPLVTGVKYYVSFKVCLAEGSCFDFNIACNKLGAKFIKYNFPYLSTPPVFNSAHVFTNTVMSDSTQWTTIKGSFVADSNYTQIMIGNFFNDVNTTTLSVGSPNKQSYYFIDDVRVSTDSTGQIVAAGENQLARDIRIYPNPASGKIHLNVREGDSPLQVTLYNTLGMELLRKIIVENAELDLEYLEEGIYYIQVSAGTLKHCEKIILRR